MDRIEQHPACLFYSTEELILQFIRPYLPEGKQRFVFAEPVYVDDCLASIAEKIERAHTQFYCERLKRRLADAKIDHDANEDRVDGEPGAAIDGVSDGKTDEGVVDGEEPGAAVDNQAIDNDLETLLKSWTNQQATQADAQRIVELLQHDPRVQLRNGHLALTIFLGSFKKLAAANSNYNHYRIYTSQLTMHYSTICQHLGRSLSVITTLTEKIEHWRQNNILPGVLPMQWLTLTREGAGYELLEDERSSVMRPCQLTTGTFDYPIGLSDDYLTLSKRIARQASERLIGERPSANEPHDLCDVLHQLVCVLAQQLGLTDVLEQLSIVYVYQDNSAKNFQSPYQQQQNLILTRVNELKKLIAQIKQKDGEYSIAQAGKYLEQLQQKSQILRQLLILMDPCKGVLATRLQPSLETVVNHACTAWLKLPEQVQEQVLPLIACHPLNHETCQRIFTLVAKNPANQSALVTLIASEYQKGGAAAQIMDRIQHRVHESWWDLPRREPIRDEAKAMVKDMVWPEEDVRHLEFQILSTHVLPPSDLSQSLIPTRLINALGMNNRYQRWKIINVLVDLVANGTFTHQEFVTALAFIRFQINELYTPDFALSKSSKQLLKKINEYFNEPMDLAAQELASPKGWHDKLAAERVFNFFNRQLPAFSIMSHESQWVRFCETFVAKDIQLNFDAMASQNNEIAINVAV